MLKTVLSFVTLFLACVYSTSALTAADFSIRDTYGTEYAFESTYYEASPTGVVSATRKAGEEWHQSDKRATVRHLVNEAQGDFACPDCYSLNTRYIATNQRYYPKGTLTIEEITDEEGHVRMTFIDRCGRTVMTREGVPGDWNDTRYVYNDYGDLLFVVQPQGEGNVRKTECFRYEYDARGRCTLKAVPGGAETRYRYDCRNRLFAEQDGNLRNDGQWLIHHYDRLGRDAFSACAKVSNATVESLCSKAFTATAPGTADNLATHTGGYSPPQELSSKLTYTELAEFVCLQSHLR